ncbi:MAG: hypothetical protein WA981_17000 [Glaciecola sp.]
MKKEITTEFNVVVTLVMFLLLIVNEVIYHEIGAKTEVLLIDRIFESEVLKVSFLFTVAIFILLGFAEIFRNIWNRLFTDLFSLREITLSEAYVMALLSSFVFLN